MRNLKNLLYLNEVTTLFSPKDKLRELLKNPKRFL